MRGEAQWGFTLAGPGGTLGRDRRHAGSVNSDTSTKVIVHHDACMDLFTPYNHHEAARHGVPQDSFSINFAKVELEPQAVEQLSLGFTPIKN